VKGLILASASAIALGLGGAGIAHAQGYPSGPTGPNAQTYYPNFSASSSYTTNPRYTPGNTAAGNTGNAYQEGQEGGAYAFVTHDQVARAQQELARAGDYTGPINGVLDPATSEALADWQSQHGLPATGGFNPPTMASLGLSTAPPYTYQPTGEATGYGYGAPYAYQGSNYQGAGAPTGAGGMTPSNTQANYGYSGNAYPGPGYQGTEMPSGTSGMAPPNARANYGYNGNTYPGPGYQGAGVSPGPGH
jgi:hypothetical protein